MYVESGGLPSKGYMFLFAFTNALTVMCAGFVLSGNTDLVDVWTV